MCNTLALSNPDPAESTRVLAFEERLGLRSHGNNASYAQLGGIALEATLPPC